MLPSVSMDGNRVSKLTSPSGTEDEGFDNPGDLLVDTGEVVCGTLKLDEKLGGMGGGDERLAALNEFEPKESPNPDGWRDVRLSDEPLEVWAKEPKESLKPEAAF